MKLHNPFLKGGASSDGYMEAIGFKTVTGNGSGFLKDDGSIDTNTYLTGTVTNINISENSSNSSYGLVWTSGTRLYKTVAKIFVNPSTGELTTSGYKRTGSSDSYFLLGGGGHVLKTAYEPAFSKNTGFNKNLGTIAGSVSEGNHTHSYEPALGNPSTNGYILSSTTGGTRSWIAPPSGGGTQNLDDVLTEGATSDLNLIIKNGASTAVATHGQTFFKVDDVTNSISATLYKDAIDFEKGGFIGSIVAPSWSASRTLTLPDKSGTLATIGDIALTLQAVTTEGATTANNIIMNSHADIILWSGNETGAKIVIDTSLFNMLDSAGTTFTQRTNAAYKATASGGNNMTLTASYLQFQKTNTLTIEPPSSIGSGRTQTLQDGSGTFAFISDIPTGAISSDADSWGASSKITDIVTLSQTEYDAIGTPSASIMYVII